MDDQYELPLLGFGLDLLEWLYVALSIIFLCLVSARLWAIRAASVKVLLGVWAYVKACLSALFVFSLVVSLALCIRDFSTSREWSVTIGSASASIVGGLGASILSFFEHRRSVRPSDILVLYLLVFVTLEVVKLCLTLGTTSTALGYKKVLQLFAIRAIPAATFLAAEIPGKGQILKPPYQDLAPEDFSGVIQRTLLWWINPVLARGNGNILLQDDVPNLDKKLFSVRLRQSVVKTWDRRAKPETLLTLPLVLFRCLGSDVLWPVPTRLFVILFRFGQPILIRQAVRFVSTPHDGPQRFRNGLWILIMAAIVYSGESICYAIYQRQLKRLSVMTRGALVGLVCNKTLRQHGSSKDGKAVTLISNDVDSLVTITEMLHEIWARAVEVVIGMTILWSEVRWLWPTPLIIIFFCAQVSRFVAQHVRSRQKGWNAATQSRLFAISNVLGSSKAVKLLGISNAIAEYIESLRLYEIEKAKSVRWMMFTYNASANALGIFAPAITMALYGIVSNLRNSTVEAETAFTVVAVLTLVTHPANMVMTFVPGVIAASASFERIQSYLLEPEVQDQRLVLPPALQATTAVIVNDMAIRNPKTGKLVLQNISMDIHRSNIVIISGPTGAGKTVLSRVLLGEITPSRGAVSVASKRIGYCDQVSWLPNGKICDVICNHSTTVDESRYARVIEATCLRLDLNALQMGDQTEIGSKGINLSGGQRQRVALARLLYATCDVVVLDDPFSALDGKTEEQVVENLFGPKGLFRTQKTTVIWITSKSRHLQIADYIFLLANSTILDQGHWTKLQSISKNKAQLITENEPRSEVGSLLPVNFDMLRQEAVVQDRVEDSTRRTGDLSLYAYYFRSTGYSALFLICCTAAYSFFITFPYYWLKWWVETDAAAAFFYITGYVLLAFLAWTTTNALMWSTILVVAPKSGLYLHEKLLKDVLGAPLQFFSMTDIGITLNRFSQDIQLVDKALPMSFQSLCVQTFKLTMQVALLLSGEKLLSFSIPICSGIVYFVQRLYLRTSRQVRLLELESRSAVLSQVMETVQGIVTIRAFNWEPQAQTSVASSLDTSQGSFYLLLCLQQWLKLVLDSIVTGLALLVIALAFFLPGSTGEGIGMALNIILVTNATLLKLVESWATFEVSMGAIARLKTLNEEIPHEDQPWENMMPKTDWPRSGAVTMRTVTASYNQNAPALRNVSVRIQPGQITLICGRTGSGKSTFMLALLHLVEYSGGIVVDELDLSRIPRAVIRDRCFITIPQDTLDLPDAPLRFSLDPSGTASTTRIVAALQRTNIWTHLCHSEESLDADAILDAKFSDLPALSVGQMQLLALARAMVKKYTLLDQTDSHCKPILLLDEATSSLDPHTEALMLDLINEEFTDQGHTVIMIAHNVGNVMERMKPDRDQVVIMADGRVDKTGSPDEMRSAMTALAKHLPQVL